MSGHLYCPDCAYPNRLIPERDEDDELIGFECEKCHCLFEDVDLDEDDEG